MHRKPNRRGDNLCAVESPKRPPLFISLCVRDFDQETPRSTRDDTNEPRRSSAQSSTSIRKSAPCSLKHIGGEKRIVCHGSQSTVRQMPRLVERSLSRTRRAFGKISERLVVNRCFGLILGLCLVLTALQRRQCPPLDPAAGNYAKSGFNRVWRVQCEQGTIKAMSKRITEARTWLVIHSKTISL